MARAILGGLLAKGTAAAADVVVVEIDAAGRARLQQEFGVAAIAGPGPEIAGADAVILAVKPQQMRQAALLAATWARDSLYVSIAAGIRVEDLSRWLGGT